MLPGMIVGPIGLPLLIVAFLPLLGGLVVLVELRILAYAYRKIGIKPRYVLGVMLLTRVGSHVDIPVYSVAVDTIVPPQAVTVFGRTYLVPETVERGATVVAVNVGGALIPVLVSIYLVVRARMSGRMLVATAVVTVAVNRLASVVPGGRRREPRQHRRAGGPGRVDRRGGDVRRRLSHRDHRRTARLNNLHEADPDLALADQERQERGGRGL
jgi:hypothetical protein